MLGKMTNIIGGIAHNSIQKIENNPTMLLALDTYHLCHKDSIDML